MVEVYGKTKDFEEHVVMNERIDSLEVKSPSHYVDRVFIRCESILYIVRTSVGGTTEEWICLLTVPFFESK